MLPTDTLLQNRYRLTQSINQSATTSLYAAIDQRLGHAVVVQLLHRADTVTFHQQARRLAHLHHAALPQVTDYFIEDGEHFLIMPSFDGQDLASVLAQRAAPFLLTDVLVWADQLLDVVEYLHTQEAPIFYCQIQPANLQLTQSGQLILLNRGVGDFTASESAGSYRGISDKMLPYASLEQLHGEASDERSALYAVGATLYHLLTGVQPPTATDRAAAIAVGKADPLQWHAASPTEFPPTLMALLNQAMALAPRERFSTAYAFRVALQAVMVSNTTSAVVPMGRATSPASQLPPHNLPLQLTPLLGREADLMQLQGLLRRSDVRLVTLIGPAGVGKTRLSQQAAWDLLADFPDGIFFSALAALHEPNLVISAIAQTVGIRESGGVPLQESLEVHLRAKETLLLLDNFEQVINAAPQLSSLLLACPRLKIMVTSRERLNVRAEHAFLVSPLAHAAAVALFTQRAQAVRPSFTLDIMSTDAVAAICKQLDYLPLAIELAAARIKVLSPQAILERLVSAFRVRFNLLRSGARDLPHRQQTLEAAIAWSYALLPATEQQLFRRLAIFVGGCTLEAAEAVCKGVNAELAPLAIDLLEGLASLHDKSLIYQTDEPSGESRFAMLVTIQVFAQEQLRQSDEYYAMQQQYAHYYLALAEEAEEAFNSQEQAVWFQRLETEQVNLRAILAWSAQIHTADELALRLVGALWYFWETYGHISEGRQWVSAILIRTASSTSPARLKVLRGAVSLATDQSDYAQGQLFAQEGLTLAKQLEDHRGIANALNGLGRIFLYQGDFRQAYVHFAESRIYWQRLGDDEGEARALNNLASVAGVLGNYAEAFALYEQSLLLFQKRGDKVRVAYAIGNMGMLAQLQADYQQAASLYSQSLMLHKELEDMWGVANALCGLGYCALYRDDFSEARNYYAKSIELHQALGDRFEVSNIVHAFATLSLAEGNLRRATLLFSTAATVRQEMTAALLPIFQEKYETDLKKIHASLPIDDFIAAWAAGQAMTLEEAVASVSQANEAG